MNHSTSETKGRAETDLLFADELEIQCVAQRSAVVPSKGPRAFAVEQFQQIELIPILPIDEENARRFPVETNLLATAPLRVVPAKQRTTAPVPGELTRSTPRIARPQRRWLVRVGALSVIAGFAIGWLAGRPLGHSVPQVRASVVVPSPVGESPLGTSGLQRDTERPAPPPAPRADDSATTTVPTAPASAANSIARKEADVVKPPAILTPSLSTSRPEAAPAPARVDTAATAPAPVPLKEMPVAPAPREPAVEKPVPPAVPAGDAPVATSTATRPPVPEKAASPVEPATDSVRLLVGRGGGGLAQRGPGRIEESFQRARCATGHLRSLRCAGYRRGRARDVCRYHDVAFEDRGRERPRTESHLELRPEECRGLVADRESGSALTD